MNCFCLCFINTKALIYTNLPRTNTNIITFVEFIRSDYLIIKYSKEVSLYLMFLFPLLMGHLVSPMFHSVC